MDVGSRFHRPPRQRKLDLSRKNAQAL
jgi:hypothetical protein